MTGIRPASRGKLLYDGKDLYEHYSELRYRIGMVPQDDVLHRQLTCGGRCASPRPCASPATCRASSARNGSARCSSCSGLTNRAKQRIDTLSGGQRKRTSVALELLTEPSLLALDEPTSGLDPALDKEVMRELRLLADRGRTVVVVTHSVLHLDLCDYVLVMCLGGRMGYFGPPDELLAFFEAEDYADVFDKVTNDAERWASGSATPTRTASTSARSRSNWPRPRPPRSCPTPCRRPVHRSSRRPAGRPGGGDRGRAGDGGGRGRCQCRPVRAPPGAQRGANRRLRSGALLGRAAHQRHAGGHRGHAAADRPVPCARTGRGPGPARSGAGPPAGQAEVQTGRPAGPVAAIVFRDPKAKAKAQPPKPVFRDSTVKPVKAAPKGVQEKSMAQQALHPVAPLRQFFTLCLRMVAVIFADRGYAALLVGLPLLLGVLSQTVPGEAGLGPDPTNYSLEAQRRLVVLIIGAAFMGIAVAIREIINESRSTGGNGPSGSPRPRTWRPRSSCSSSSTPSRS
jgi:ABC-type multidrug transport system ATPase subunit